MLHVKTCGIYKITNTITNETYIGQSRNITKRIATHKEDLKIGDHVNKGLQEDYDLAKSLDPDFEIFSFEIVKEVKEKDLNKEEMYWINEFNSFERGYNKTIGGIHDETKGHVDYGGGRLFTDEKRIKLIIKKLTNDFDNKKNYIFKTTSKEVLCSKCGNEFNDEFEFCPYCGTEKPKTKICPKCKLEPSIEFSFCPKCGTELVDKEEYLKQIEEKRLRKIKEEEEIKRREIEEQKQLKMKGLTFEKEGDGIFEQIPWKYEALYNYIHAKEIYKSLAPEVYDSSILLNLCEKLVKNGNILYIKGNLISRLDGVDAGATDYYNEAKEICKSLDSEVYDTESILAEIDDKILKTNEKISRLYQSESLKRAREYENNGKKGFNHGWFNGALHDYQEARKIYKTIDRNFYVANLDIKRCDKKIKEIKLEMKKLEKSKP